MGAFFFLKKKCYAFQLHDIRLTWNLLTKQMKYVLIHVPETQSKFKRSSGD